MQIHELSVPAKKSRKRIGRGGKRGTYSGRGLKGQKARSGGNVDPLFEGGRSSLVERMKNTRGAKPLNLPKVTVTLAKIDRLYSDEEVVSLGTLVQKRVLSKKTRSQSAKIVATGEITKKVIISGKISISEKAHDAVLKAGGTVEES